MRKVYVCKSYQHSVPVRGPHDTSILLLRQQISVQLVELGNFALDVIHHPEGDQDNSDINLKGD